MNSNRTYSLLLLVVAVLLSVSTAFTGAITWKKSLAGPCRAEERNVHVVAVRKENGGEAEVEDEVRQQQQ